MAQSFGRNLGLAALFAIVAGPAAAQDDPRLALVTSFPTPTISLQWELSDRFALRFEGSYSFRDDSSQTNSGEHDSLGQPGAISIQTVTTVETTVHTTSFAVAGIYALHRSDQLRLYVAPRIGIGIIKQHVGISTAVVNPPPGRPASVLNFFERDFSADDASTNPTLGLAFGAATHVNRRLALFGEAGFNYSTADGPTGVATIISSVPSSSVERSTVSTRAIGGVMFYF